MANYEIFSEEAKKLSSFSDQDLVALAINNDFGAISIEANRRLGIAINKLDASTQKLTRKLIVLTYILVGLTVVIAGMTGVLIWQGFMH